MKEQSYTLVKTIRQTAFTMGCGGLVTFVATFAVAASFHIPIQLTLTYSTYQGKMVLEIKPLNICKLTPIIPDKQEKLVAQVQ